MTNALFCEHCQLPIEPHELVTVTIDGQLRQFCCRGCQGAYQLIIGAGLEQFYQQRIWSEPGPTEGAFATSFNPDLIESLVHKGEQGYELSFLIEGIRCASCVWLNEKILLALPGVIDARINYGTHRARVRFDPQLITPLEIFSRITQLGYRPRPMTARSLQEVGIRERRTLLIRFGTAVFLSMQLMGYSLALYAGYFQGIDPHARQLIQYFAAGVTTPVVFYAGWPFLSGAWRSLRNRAPNMDLLIALGVLTAYSYSLLMLATGGEVYFDSAAMIVTLILLGRLLESTARRLASAGIDRLLQLAPDRSIRLNPSGGQEVVETGLLQPGDLILVGPGERFATDGALAEGETDVDESIVTGEPLPVHRSAGDKITSGSLNISTSVTLRVATPASESFIAKVARLVEEAQARRAPAQALADRVSAWFVPAVILLALGTFGFWLQADATAGVAILNATAVLVVACPCALGLATPTAILVATGAATKNGILFRGGDILERTARLDTIAFDKTGTLTEGVPAVSRIVPHGISSDELLSLAARIESGTRHPIATAIQREAVNRGLTTPFQSSVKTIPGQGLQLDLPGETLFAGHREFILRAGIEVPPLESTGLTEVYLARNQSYLGAIVLEDRIRPEAATALEILHANHYRTSLLTGDPSAAGQRVTTELGISSLANALTPEQKADWVRVRQQMGHLVMMVGDGINDAPALAAADIGCAMAGGTDIALETSDIILTRPDLGKLAEAVTLAKRTLRIIRENLFWAFTYNLVAIPLAASGKLAPAYAAAAMAVSSVLVVGNSLRLNLTPSPARLSQSTLKRPEHA
jgi:P-type Cu2+ transporter